MLARPNADVHPRPSRRPSPSIAPSIAGHPRPSPAIAVLPRPSALIPVDGRWSPVTAGDCSLLDIRQMHRSRRVIGTQINAGAIRKYLFIYRFIDLLMDPIFFLLFFCIVNGSTSARSEFMISLSWNDLKKEMRFFFFDLIWFCSEIPPRCYLRSVCSPVCFVWFDFVF